MTKYFFADRITAIAERNQPMLASQLQANSSVRLPANIAQIMASAGLGPIHSKIGVPDLDRKLKEAGVPVSKRLELKIFLNRAGLLVDGSH